jgi:hypothetical protein
MNQWYGPKPSESIDELLQQWYGFKPNKSTLSPDENTDAPTSDNGAN